MRRSCQERYNCIQHKFKDGKVVCILSEHVMLFENKQLIS